MRINFGDCTLFLKIKNTPTGKSPNECTYCSYCLENGCININDVHKIDNIFM